MKPITAAAVAAGSLDHIIIAARGNYFAYPHGATYEEVETDLMGRGYFIKPIDKKCVQWAIDKANGTETFIDTVSPQLCLFD